MLTSVHIRRGGAFVVKSTGLYPAVGVESGEVSAVGLAGDVEAVGTAIRRITGEPGAITGLCAPGRGESGIEPGRPVRYRRAVRRGGSRVLEKEVRELGRAVDSAGCRDSLMREASWRGV